MLFGLQLSPWLTTFGINVMILLINIAPPEQSVHKELEYCFILLSSLSSHILTQTAVVLTSNSFICVSSVSLFSYAILLPS